jgi:hypothetical protein
MLMCMVAIAAFRLGHRMTPEQSHFFTVALALTQVNPVFLPIDNSLNYIS